MSKRILHEKSYVYCPSCKTELTSKTIEGHSYKACRNCGFVFWNDPKPSVSVLLVKDRKILMLQRINEPFKNYWVLPGGYIGSFDKPEEAAVREAKEETGLDVFIRKIVGVYRTAEDPRGIDIDIIFYCESKQDTPTLSKEDKAWKYFSPDALPKHIAYKHREAIQDWFTKGGQYS